jgi:hypothetical protein
MAECSVPVLFFVLVQDHLPAHTVLDEISRNKDHFITSHDPSITNENFTMLIT